MSASRFSNGANADTATSTRLPLQASDIPEAGNPHFRQRLHFGRQVLQPGLSSASRSVEQPCHHPRPQGTESTSADFVNGLYSPRSVEQPWALRVALV